jgi:CubicO group peptidase (beta-lactamase class C family)
VTIKQLINHTSGLEDAEEYFGTLDSTKITNNDVLQMVFSRKSVRSKVVNLNTIADLWNCLP